MKNEGEITRLTHEPNYEQFAQKQEEVCHFVQDRHPEGAQRIIYPLQKRNCQSHEIKHEKTLHL